MADFINTIDLLGDDVVVKSIIEKKITEFNDDVLQKIGAHSLQNSQKLVSVNLPNVTFIDDYGFYGCNTLATVNFPKVTRVGHYAFYGCTSLTSVNLPSWDTNYTSSYVFENCSSLQSIDFPVGILGLYAFRGCSALKTVILRKGSVCSLSLVDTFAKTPFASGNAGGTLLVPRSLTASYQTATNWSSIFSGNANNRVLALEDYTIDGTITGEIDWISLSVARGLVSRTIKSFESDTLTSVGESAFYSCNKMTSVSLPNVTSVGSYAFRACGNLVSVDFPELETTTGQYAFAGCSKLEIVNMPKLKKVDFWAFEQCKSLKSIDLLNVTYIENAAFQNCSALVSVRLPATPPELNSASTVFKGINSACVFYVPTGSLAAYQADSKWSTITTTYSFVEEDR